jgi:hypothetical protein
VICALKSVVIANVISLSVRKGILKVLSCPCVCICICLHIPMPVSSVEQIGGLS